MRHIVILVSVISLLAACAPESRQQPAYDNPAGTSAPAPGDESLLDVASPEEVATELGLEATAPIDELSPLSVEQINKSLKLDLLQQFPIVIVINKAIQGPSKQKMKVYHRGQLAYTFPVSTGREKTEVAKSGRQYFTTTPVGWFAPTKTFQKYWSNTWEAWMEYSVFFIGGIAMHATTPDHYSELGRRASGGCVRLHKDNAKIVYDLVLAEGKGTVPVFTRDGRIAKNLAGHVKTQTSWNTLVIVEDNPAE